MSKDNIPLTRWTALVDGVPTGLAGCTKQCDGCLRGADLLVKEQSQYNYRKGSPYDCGAYIVSTAKETN